LAYAATNLTPEGPTVAYFANQLADKHGHGLARYSMELLASLRNLNSAHIVPVAGWSGLSEEDFKRRQEDIGLRLTRLGRKGTSLLWTFLDFPSIESRLREPVDVVHAVSLGYPVATKKSLVVTIHDLGPLTHPQFFKNTRPWVMERSLKQAVNQADVIVCVSQSTADEVLSYTGAHLEDRIEVVLEGVSPLFRQAPDPSALNGVVLPDKPIILSAGANSPRKNLAGLLKAMRLAKDSIPHDLVLVGGSGWDTGEFKRVLSEHDISGRVHQLGFVSDEVLHALYHKAEVYAHPSLYEGFGLPVLEAMAAGTPVIASNRSSLPEVAGDAARLSDTTDPEAFAADLIEICASESLRAEMRKAGQARAATFRWSDSATAMSRIYNDLSPRIAV